MNFTLNQLRIFQKVVSTLSITKAAEELHLSQPAVSIQLKNFQDQFGALLIEVINRKVYVTDFGKEIALAVDKILSEVDAISYLMHAHKGELTGKLKFSVVSTGKYVAPYFIADFMKKHKGVEFQIDVTNKAQVLSSLERNEVEFALVSVLPEYPKTEKLELIQNKLYLVGNHETKYDQKTHDKTIFESIPLIYREQGSGTRQVMEKFILQNHLPVQKKMELTSNEAVKQSVIAGLGYSIMPLIGIKNELLNGQLQIIPVKGFPIKSTWYLIWLKGKQLSPVAEAFLDHLKREKQSIIDGKFDWYEKY
jgi:DNA-binding transcriptional LysR family regulator